MASTEASTVCILMKDKMGRGLPNKDGEEPWQCNLSRGELVVEIPEKERVPEAGGQETIPNFRLHSDPEVAFFASPTDILPLDDNQLYYLLAVQPASVRIREYLRPLEMKEKMALVVGDGVIFKLSIQPQSTEFHANGIIRYIGPLSEKDGLYFGIEILEKQYRGKGTSNGRPHFSCSPNNAIFIAMDKIVKKYVHNLDQSSLQNPKNTITEQPKSKSKTSQNPSGRPSDNTRSKVDYTKSKPSSVKEMVQAIDNPAHAVDDSAVASGASQFQPGHHVVLQSRKGDVISGTVRWVGPIKVSKGVGVPPIPTVGIETDQKIDPDEHFPDLHINVTTSFGTKMFKVSNDHSRVFLPEQLVLHADSYAQKRQEEHAIQHEAELARQFGLSVAEYRSQKEVMKKANFQRDSKYDQKVAQHPDPPIEGDEEGHVAGLGKYREKRDTNNDQQMTESMYLVGSGQQVSHERVEEEREALEQMKSQHTMKKDHEDTPPADYQVIEGGRESMTEESYIDISPYTTSQQGRNGAHDNRSQHTSSNLDAIKEGERGENYSPRAAPRSTNRSPRSAHRDIDNGGPASLPSYSNTPPPLTDNSPLQFTIGSMVRVPTQRGQPLLGVVQWIGTVPDIADTVAGVELEEPLTGCTDGTWQGRRYFNCPPGRAFFCPVTALKQDTRFIDEGQIPANLREGLKNPLEYVPTVEEYDTIVTPELFTKYIGDEHGIQGHHNSCYLDSTVFGLFALSESFDELLLEEPQEEVGRQVKKFLWKGIVNPLRKYGLARHESVMSLRNSLEEFGRMKGAKTDEKDPEEFLNLLFKEVLHVDPFLSIKRPFGVEKEYFIQLFFEIDPKETQIPKTDKLLVQMFHEQNISFTRVPSKLLLQMPRFGKDFKMYNRIIPSLTLDVKPLLDPSSRGRQDCYFCKTETVTHACYNCPKEVAHTDDPYLFYCTECNKRAHWERKGHRMEEVIVQPGTGDVKQMSKLQLLSVICIETSHYVCYTRSGDRWLFHDSMADRYYDMYNIPKVVDVTQELQDWVYSEKGTEKLMTSPAKSIPEYVRRFTQDIYMCVYVNADLDLYGAPDASMLAGVTGGAYQEEKHLPAELRDRHDDHPNRADQDRARQGGGGDGYYQSEEDQRHYERHRGGAHQGERNLHAESDRRDVHPYRVADQDRARRGGGGDDYNWSEGERRHHYENDRGGAHQGERNLHAESDRRNVHSNRAGDHERARQGGEDHYWSEEDQRYYRYERDRGHIGVRDQHGYQGNGDRHPGGGHYADGHGGAYPGRGGGNYRGQGGSGLDYGIHSSEV